MKNYFVLLLPFAVYAQDLRTLIDLAYTNNNLVKSSTLSVESKQKVVDAKKVRIIRPLISVDTIKT